MPGNIASSQPNSASASSQLDAGLEALAKAQSNTPPTPPASPVAPATQTLVSAVPPDPVLKPSSMVANGSTPGAGAIDVFTKLLEKGVLTQENYQLLKVESASSGKQMETLAIEKGIITEENIYKNKSEMTGIPFVTLTNLVIPTEVIQKIPFDTAQKNNAIAFEAMDGQIKVAMTDPLDIQKINFLGAVAGRKVIPHYATPSDVKRILDTKYSVKIEEDVTEALEDVGDAVVIGPTIGKEQDLSEAALSSAPVARIVNMVLEYATKFNSSDVHIEPREGKVSVRYRLNGVMSERLTLPKKLAPSIVSRLKILANLKIDEHRVPQDGRFQIKVGEKNVDLRVSIMPSIYGEKVVMRLLEKGGGVLSIEGTGMRGSGLKVFRNALEKTQGIILVTGPTGSGKTQTLASSLKILNTQEVNILTLEDPVEIRMDGITQVQINEEVGLTFAKGLRSFLRQDPDIIMVGEIRDQETAELAVQAALTGHLVLATLHTNSAAGAMPRLLDMGVEPFLLASTINVSVGQRLVRTICKDCKEKYVASEPMVAKIHEVLQGLKGFDLNAYPKLPDPTAVPGVPATKDMSKVPTGEIVKQQAAQGPKQVYLYRGKGCPKCGDTGYAGRIAIFEVMEFNEKVSRLVMEHRSADEIEKSAIENGMVTMAQDGFMKALDGDTTIEEVLRVVNK